MPRAVWSAAAVAAVVGLYYSHWGAYRLGIYREGRATGAMVYTSMQHIEAVYLQYGVYGLRSLASSPADLSTGDPFALVMSTKSWVKTVEREVIPELRRQGPEGEAEANRLARLAGEAHKLLAQVEKK